MNCSSDNAEWKEMAPLYLIQGAEGSTCGVVPGERVLFLVHFRPSQLGIVFRPICGSFLYYLGAVFLHVWVTFFVKIGG